MPLRPAEIIQHPAFENVIYDLQPTKKGFVPVAIGRGGPFNIAYEVHGSGPKHLVVSQPSLFQGSWELGEIIQCEFMAHVPRVIVDNRAGGL